MRFVARVGDKKVVVEVIYVRPSRFGDHRIVVRRVDTGLILHRARSIADLRPVRG